MAQAPVCNSAPVQFDFQTDSPQPRRTLTSQKFSPAALGSSAAHTRASFKRLPPPSQEALRSIQSALSFSLNATSNSFSAPTAAAASSRGDATGGATADDFGEAAREPTLTKSAFFKEVEDEVAQGTEAKYVTPGDVEGAEARSRQAILHRGRLRPLLWFFKFDSQLRSLQVAQILIVKKISYLMDAEPYFRNLVWNEGLLDRNILAFFHEEVCDRRHWERVHYLQRMTIASLFRFFLDAISPAQTVTCVTALDPRGSSDFDRPQVSRVQFDVLDGDRPTDELNVACYVRRCSFSWILAHEKLGGRLLRVTASRYAFVFSLLLVLQRNEETCRAAIEWEQKGERVRHGYFVVYNLTTHVEILERSNIEFTFHRIRQAIQHDEIVARRSTDGCSPSSAERKLFLSPGTSRVALRGGANCFSRLNAVLQWDDAVEVAEGENDVVSHSSIGTLEKINRQRALAESVVGALISVSQVIAQEPSPNRSVSPASPPSNPMPVIRCVAELLQARGGQSAVRGDAAGVPACVAPPLRDATAGGQSMRTYKYSDISPSQRDSWHDPSYNGTPEGTGTVEYGEMWFAAALLEVLHERGARQVAGEECEERNLLSRRAIKEKRQRSREERVWLLAVSAEEACNAESEERAVLETIEQQDFVRSWEMLSREKHENEESVGRRAMVVASTKEKRQRVCAQSNGDQSFFVRTAFSEHHALALHLLHESARFCLEDALLPYSMTVAIEFAERCARNQLLARFLKGRRVAAKVVVTTPSKGWSPTPHLLAMSRLPWEVVAHALETVEERRRAEQQCEEQQVLNFRLLEHQEGLMRIVFQRQQQAVFAAHFSSGALKLMHELFDSRNPCSEPRQRQGIVHSSLVELFGVCVVAHKEITMAEEARSRYRVQFVSRKEARQKIRSALWQLECDAVEFCSDLFQQEAVARSALIVRQMKERRQRLGRASRGAS